MRPLEASFLDDPYPLYRQLRDEHPVYCDTSFGRPIWLLSRHRDVNAALADWKTFSSVQGPAPRPTAFDMRNREGGTQMIESDPPFHDHLRQTVQARFSPRGVRYLDSVYRERAIDLLRPVPDVETFDIAADFAWRLTLAVTGELIGIPERDRSMVLGWYQDVIYSGAPDRASKSAVEYGDYFCELASERYETPRDDLMSDLMRLVSSKDVDRADAVLLCMDLFEGCVDVPANFLGNAVVTLAGHPDARSTLADPEIDAGLMRTAIEELARFDTPIQYLPRVTVQPVTLHDVAIPVGSRVRLILASANRDERHYEDADRLDLARPIVRSVVFGTGVHFCIGASLARLGLGIALPLLLRAMPYYTLEEPVERPRGADIMRALLHVRVRPNAGEART